MDRRWLRSAVTVIGLTAALGTLSTAVASAAPIGQQVGTRAAAAAAPVGAFGPLRQICLICWWATPAGETSGPDDGWHTEVDLDGNEYCVEDGFVDPGPGAPGGPGVR